MTFGYYKYNIDIFVDVKDGVDFFLVQALRDFLGGGGGIVQICLQA